MYSGCLSYPVIPNFKKYNLGEFVKFLLADDHVLVREGLRDFLLNSFKGSKVVETGSLDETLRCLTKPAEPFDLVLLDLLMPGMTGHKSIKHVCASSGNIPVAILSGTDTSPKNLQAVFDNGASGFFPKSMTGSSLKQAIKHVLSGEKFIPPQILFSPAPPKAKSSAQFPLSNREVEVLNLLVEGLTNREIAERLGIAEPTIKMHVKNLFRKIGVSNRTQAVTKFPEGFE